MTPTPTASVTTDRQVSKHEGGRNAAASLPSASLSSSTKYPQGRPMRLCIFGTHPQQYNGYAKVVYELIREMSQMKEVQVFVFGFQNIQTHEKSRYDNIPDNVTIYDAFSDETPKKQGFGIELVKNYVSLTDPDVVLIYNDLHIISQVLNELKDVINRRFKIITYIDQVYTSQNSAMVEFVNKHADAALAFSNGWQKCIQEQGLSLPIDFIPHGVNSHVHYPIPRHLARKYYGFSEDDFIILNMNRNQPRKRWDVCLKAHAELVSRYPNKPIKLIVATSPRGAWNIPELYLREIKKRGISAAQGLSNILFVDAPQRMSDREVNMMYNVCDVGVNTCDGEGFGLCNVEQACVGKPQVVPRLGAFPDVFDNECAMLIEPRCEFYLDSATKDILGGDARMCSHVDFADALCKYYEDPSLREKHGKLARKRVLDSYKWCDVARKLVDFARDVRGVIPLEEEDGEYKQEEEKKTESSTVSVSPQSQPSQERSQQQHSPKQKQVLDVEVDDVRSLMRDINERGANTNSRDHPVDKNENHSYTTVDPNHGKENSSRIANESKGVGNEKKEDFSFPTLNNQTTQPQEKKDKMSDDAADKDQQKNNITAQEKKRAKQFEKLQKEMQKMQAMMAAFSSTGGSDDDDEEDDK